MLPNSPELDNWLPDPTVRVSHRRESSVSAERLWEAARGIRLHDTHLLGRMVRWRIPGVEGQTTFHELFREPPFAVLEEADAALISGLVGRIWTLRRDYPELEDPDGFRSWSEAGTARVLFANWVEPAPSGRSVLRSETRVEAFGAQGRLGLATMRPLIRGFQQLIGSEGMTAAVKRAETA